MVDFYCNGSEMDAQRVMRMTCEDFYFWLERKIKHAKMLAKAQGQKKQSVRNKIK